jgi:NAD(P)H dehydrogenase (quinone)
MTVAITGATGHLGRLVIQQLQARGAASDLVALARSPEKAGDLGVAVRQADYDRPETLGAALAGVDTLLLISASELGKRVPQHRNVIDAATRSGVKRVIYTSLLHADRSIIDLAAEHRETEAMLGATGLPLTILRNGWYTENYTASAPAALANGAFYGSAGDGRISGATRADFAAAAVAVLVGSGHEGRTYELAGDESFTLAELAAEISRQVGREIPYRDLPVPEYAAALVGAGLPEPLARTIAQWDADAAKGALFHEGHELSALIGRPTTPLRDAVTAAIGKR